MRRVAGSIIALSFVCLLAMQMSGLHLHVDSIGQDAGLHGSHLHNVSLHDHDHSADTDVSLLELATAWSKFIPLIFACVIALFAASWMSQLFWSPPVQASKTHHRIRWRPLLRAPPISL